jgi:hypothetical protein
VWWSMTGRRLGLSVIAALVGATALVTVAACGKSEVKLSPEIEAALKYLPTDPAAIVLVPTDLDSGPIQQLDRLGEQKVRGWDRIKRRIEREISKDASRAEIDAIVGNPLAFSFSGPGSDNTNLAIQVQDAAIVRKMAEKEINKGEAKALPEYQGAYLWQDTEERKNGDGDTDFNGLKQNVLFAADTEALLESAIDNADGQDNASGEDDFKRKLDELGDDSLVRLVGDAQTPIDNAKGNNEQVEKIKFVKAMGMFWSKSTVTADGIDSESVLETKNEDLSSDDLPLPEGNATFEVPSKTTLAAIGLTEPDHIFKFAENAAKQANPQGFQQYEAGLSQVKSASGVDLHTDLVSEIEQISVALVGGRQAEFRAKLKDADAFKQAFRKIQGLLSQGLAGQGLTLAVKGSGDNATYVLRQRSGKEVARFAIRGDSVVGSVGPRGDLPSPTAGSPIPGVSGALAFVIDYGNLVKLRSVRGQIDEPLAAEALGSLGPSVSGVTETTDRLTIKSKTTLGD